MFNDMTGTTLNNSDLRYALWRNAENATEKRDDNPLALASDIAMRDRLNRSTEEPGMAMFSVAPSPSVSRDALTKNTPHSYEVTKIELIEDSSVTPNDGIDRPLNRSTNSITAAKLLENVEKSYDEGVKILQASKKIVNLHLFSAFAPNLLPQSQRNLA
jgi:hypothetical protein